MPILDIFTTDGRQRRKVERDYRIAEARFETQAMLTETTLLNAVNRHNELLIQTSSLLSEADSPYDGGWKPAGLYDDDKMPDGYDPRVLVKNIRQGKYTKPTIGNIIDNFRKYGVDDGANFSAADDDETIQAAVDNYALANLPTSVQKEYIERFIRDGEVFRLLDAEGGKFLDPENIKTPTEHSNNSSVSEGVRFEGSSPAEYYYFPDKDAEAFDVIPVEQLIHTKNGVDANQPRGVSRITSGVYNLIVGYESLEKNRRWQLEIRSAVAVNQVVTGGQVGVSVARSANSTDSDPSGKTNKVKKFRAGTFIRSSPGVETKFESPNVQGADSEVVARGCRLQICAAVGLPEHLLMADASNANYSSTTAATKEQWATVRDVRGTIGDAMIKEVEHYLRQTEQLPKTFKTKKPTTQAVQDDFGAREVKKFVDVEVPTTLKVIIDWPELDVIDDDKQANAVTKDIGNRLVSRRTAMVKRGYDPEYEEAQIQAEQSETDAQMMQMQDRLGQEMGNDMGGGDNDK